MKWNAIELWADSLGKGVVFDEGRRRYVIAPDRCAATLEEALSTPLRNHSRMGATVAEGYQEFMETETSPGGLVVIAYGGNDCDMPWKEVSENPEGEYFGKIPIGQFEKTLAAFVGAARDRGLSPLLVTPPPLEAQRYFDWVTRDLSQEAVLRFLGDVNHIYRWQERYSIAVRRVAQAEGCPLFDLRDAFLACRHYPDMLCVDGIHPNARGHAFITQAVLAQREALQKKLASAAAAR